jgi:flagellar protein FliL
MGGRGGVGAASARVGAPIGLACQSALFHGILNGGARSPAAPPLLAEVQPQARMPASPLVERFEVKKLLVIGCAVLLLAGGGAGAWWWWASRAAAAGGDQDGEHREPSGKGRKASAHETAAVALDPFLVNLADRDASRFLRVTLQLVVDNPELARAFAGKGHGTPGPHDLAKVRLRSAVLELLTTQRADRLVTPEGKEELKRAIADRTSEVLAQAEVVDVLFTDFVVQF